MAQLSFMQEDFAGGAFGIKGPGGGGGDVVGPASSTTNNIAVFGDTSGNVLADGGVSIAQLQAGSDYATLTVGASGADHTTIQAALDAIGASGGTIWLLDAAYAITTGLLVKSSRVEIIGKGNGTRIHCDGAVVTTLLKANATTFQGFALRNVLLEQTNGTVQGIAIDASNMSLCVYDNVRILNFGTAVKADDTANNTFYNTFRNIKIFECNNGLDFTSTNPFNDNWFYDIRIGLRAGGAGTGLKMTNAQGNAFYNLNVEPATAAGITGIALTTANVLDTLFVNLYAENNATNVSIGAAVVRTTFIGGTNTLATSTNLSDAGFQTSIFNQRLGSVLKNQFSPFEAKDGGNASAIAGSFFNNTSFAHTASTLVKMELLNGTDTSPVLTLANAGTGNYITAGTAFTVTKAGAVTGAANLITGIAGSTTGKIRLLNASSSAEYNIWNNPDPNIPYDSLWFQRVYSQSALGDPFATLTVVRAPENSAVISSIDTGTEIITTTAAHLFDTGAGVILQNSGGALPAPLVTGTFYAVRNLSATTLALYPTVADAIADTNRINLTTGGTGTNTIYLSTQEATTTYQRMRGTINEFMDVYANGYEDSMEFGIRLQKRGTGAVLRPFIISNYDGSTRNTLAYFDNINNRIGLGGNVAPSVAVDITGALQTTGEISVNSAGTATMAIDRGAITNFGLQIFRTAGTDEWIIGQINNSTNNFYVQDAVNGFSVLVMAQGATPITTAAGTWNHTGLTTVSGNNLVVGAAAAGATAVNVLALSNSATAPTTSVDLVQLYGVDISAGNASLGITTETAVVTETVVSDRTLAIKVNGTTYKICLKV